MTPHDLFAAALLSESRRASVVVGWAAVLIAVLVILLS